MHRIKQTNLSALWPAMALMASFLTTSPVAGQEPPDSVRVELRRLAALVDSLRAEVARLQAAGEEEGAGDALARLRAAAEQAAAAGARPQEAEDESREFVGRQRSLQALNPEISVSSDVFASLDPDARSEDNFYARAFELSLVSNLDPFSRAKIFISRHQEAGDLPPFGEEEGADAEGDPHGGGFAVEEGYVEWVGLPGGLGLKLGRFFQRFGTLNRWHAHALPFQSRSLPHQAFIGEESLGQTGASVSWLAPFSGGGGTYEASLEVTSTSQEHLFGEFGGVSVLGHVNGFWQLSPAVDLDVGASWIGGRYEDDVNTLDRDLFGVEMSLHWAPPQASRYRGFNLRGGVMILDGLLPPGTPPAGGDAPSRASGFWTMGELRLSQSWLVGGRFDRVEDPNQPDESAWLAGPTLTWWQSEYVRVRAEYDMVGHSTLDNRGRFYLQVTFAMGPHKHENY